MELKLQACAHPTRIETIHSKVAKPIFRPWGLVPMTARENDRVKGIKQTERRESEEKAKFQFGGSASAVGDTRQRRNAVEG